MCITQVAYAELAVDDLEGVGRLPHRRRRDGRARPREQSRQPRLRSRRALRPGPARGRDRRPGRRARGGVRRRPRSVRARGSSNAASSARATERPAFRRRARAALRGAPSGLAIELVMTDPGPAYLNPGQADRRAGIAPTRLRPHHAEGARHRRDRRLPHRLRSGSRSPTRCARSRTCSRRLGPGPAASTTTSRCSRARRSRRCITTRCAWSPSSTSSRRPIGSARPGSRSRPGPGATASAATSTCSSGRPGGNRLRVLRRDAARRQGRDQGVVRAAEGVQRLGGDAASDVRRRFLTERGDDPDDRC